MANPSKDGDAKLLDLPLLINSQGCQAAEDGVLMSSIAFCGLGISQARIFLHLTKEIGIVPRKANPSKDGDAKPWVYRCPNSHDRQAAEDEP